MLQRSFFVRACWDEEAKVFYSESDIEGLHIETETIAEFEEIMRASAIELIIANHVSPQEMSSTPMKDLVPSIFWQPPQGELVCA
ncbi:DUF1902 domain-containing protein [Henriciella barbarensis]|uniref:DUF1902 domain-containing protein n=1 Tax=Henriciella barbarensis TaxID=86342 RepID=A0A399QSU4_9PROT|nr:DUF1902 domain-containing protein [Henriciella barbarensis]RIJ21561.1 DUF1902 domain-containing protein [Henriciella barbarensis]